MNPRKPETPSAFEAADLRLLESKLADWSAKIRAAREHLEAKQAGRLYVFRAPTLQKALQGFESWIDSLTDSVFASVTGSPIGEQTRKTRKIAEPKTRYRKK